MNNSDTEDEIESSNSDNDLLSIFNNESTLDKFLKDIEEYKKDLQERVIPNDEDGPSQTEKPLEIYEKILINDNESLINGTDDISEEAKKHLLQYFTQENTYSDLINFFSILTLNLIIYPYSLNQDHINKLKNNN